MTWSIRHTPLPGAPISTSPGKESKLKVLWEENKKIVTKIRGEKKLEERLNISLWANTKEFSFKRTSKLVDVPALSIYAVKSPLI